MAGYVAGLYRVLMGIVGANGQSLGIQTTLANGSTSGAYVFKRAQTANLAHPDPTTLPITGGDKQVTLFQFGNTPLSSFDLMVADLDPALFALLGSTVDNTTTNTSFEFFGTNDNLTVPITVWVALISRYQDVSIGANGPDKYVTTVIPRCTPRVKLGGQAYQAHAPVTIKLTPTYSDRTPNGQTFDATGLNMTFEDNLATHYGIISTYPLHLMSFRSDGTATSFTTTYKPVSSAITAGATPNYFFRNGTSQALASVVTSTGVATMAAAGTAGDLNTLLYQVNTNYQ